MFQTIRQGALDSRLFLHLRFLSPLKAVPSLELVVRYQGYFLQAISETTTLGVSFPSLYTQFVKFLTSVLKAPKGCETGPW